VKLLVNGQLHEVASFDVATVLEELHYGGSVVATAVNGVFIPAESRSTARIADGDRLEVVAPMQGG